MNNWEMYDDEGNAAVAEMMQRIKDALNTQPLPSVRTLLHQGIKEVGKKHGEIYDTEVRNIITYRLTEWALLANKMRINSDYWNL